MLSWSDLAVGAGQQRGREIEPRSRASFGPGDALHGREEQDRMRGQQRRVFEIHGSPFSLVLNKSAYKRYVLLPTQLVRSICPSSPATIKHKCSLGMLFCIHFLVSSSGKERHVSISRFTHDPDNPSNRNWCMVTVNMTCLPHALRRPVIR